MCVAMGALVMTRGKTVKSWAMMTAACMALGAPVFGVAMPAASAKADAPTAAPAVQVRYFRIAEQDLVAALNEFGRQSGRDILFSTEVAGRKRSGAVNGPMTAEQALRALLVGTGLAFRATNDRTFLVEVANQRAASAQPGEADTPPSGQEGNESGEPPREQQVEKVTVTGSRVGDKSSPVIKLDRKDLERTGEPTLARALKTLPQNYASQGEVVDTDPNGSNLNGGGGVNLRGLGFDATLVLIDGRRLAKGGAGGTFSDIANLPLAAVERVEILTDGASAIYGSDALAGVVNIITRRDPHVTEISLRESVTTQAGYDETLGQFVVGREIASWDVLFVAEYYRQSGLARRDREFARSMNYAPRGGSDFRSVTGSVTALDGNLNAVSALTGTTVASAAIPLGQNGRSLTPSDFVAGVGVVNRFDTLKDGLLIPEEERFSFYGSARTNLSETTEFSAQAVYGKRDRSRPQSYRIVNFTVPATNPFNPFGESVRVSHPFTDLTNGPVDAESETFGFTPSLTWRPGDWTIDVGATYSEQTIDSANCCFFFSAAANAALADTNPATALNVFGLPSENNPNTIANLVDANLVNSRSFLTEADAIARRSISLGSWGTIDLATGAQFRNEGISFQQVVRSFAVNRVREGDRDVAAGFGELLWKLASPDDDIEGLNKLEISGALRLENYSDFGRTVDPKFGLVWSPFDPISLRATWGESFKAPNFNDLLEPSSAFPGFVVFDPRRGETASVTFIAGGNPNLTAETAETWTAGAIFEPDWLDGFRAEATYFGVEYQDKIVRLVDPLANETPETVVRAPASPADIAAGLPGPILTVDSSARNLSSLVMSGVDLSVRGAVDTDAGQFTLGGNASYVLEYRTKLVETAPEVDFLGVRGNPPTLRFSVSADWSRGPWNAGVSLLSTNAYRLTTLPTSPRIEGYDTANVRLSYAFDSLSNVLEGVRLSVGVNNLFDEEPPFVNLQEGYDPIVADARQRIVYLEIRKAW
jgi:iron complex outermembrane recepter protein